LRAVAVFDGEAAAVERQAHATPCAVESVVDLQGRGGLAFDDASARISASQRTSQPPCTAPTDLQADCGILQAAFDNHHRDKNIAAAGFIGAGIGAGSLLGTLLLWKSPNPGNAGIAVRPQFGRHMLGLSLSLKY